MKGMLVAVGCAILMFGIFLHTYSPQEQVSAKALDSPLLGPLALERKRFYDVVIPLAKQEGSVNLYSHAASFPSFWKSVVIPQFERQYGIKVKFFNTKSDLADRQLMSFHELGHAPPADVYFAPHGHMGLYRQARLAGNADLADLLPQAAAIPHAMFDELSPDGRFAPFHVNQTALAYDIARLPAARMPRDFETLLEWSRANPGAFALTSPKNGGSGEGFLIGVANHFMDDACRRAFYDDAMSATDALRWVNNSACLDTTWDYLRALYPLAAITNGNAATQNLIANHGATIGTVWEDLTFVFVKRKLQEPTVRLSMPESGMPASADALFVVAGAAHPAAALLLIDFALSKPIQEWKLQQMGSRSPRDDIDEEGLPGQPSRNLLSVAQRRAVPRWPSSPVVAALDNAFVKQVVEAGSSK